MKKYLFVFISATLLLSCIRKPESGPAPDRPGNNNDNLVSDVYAWITSPQNNTLFQQYGSSLNFSAISNPDPVIIVDTSQTFQTIDGFGNCLTGGSAIVLNKMTKANRTALLKELFSTDGKNIGISYLRISIGASDLSDKVFSYDDLPSGQTDPQMLQFNINYEKTDLIPVLKEILAINPSIRILGSPWSAPVWMKTNNSSIGGILKPECYAAYAKYFVKYIQAMKKEGITIDAITIQNEPLYGGNNPSMVMQPGDQALFIKQNLGPAFSEAGITTKIIVYDHNADQPDYPMTVYSDPDAAQYIDGAAFHLYGGSIDALSTVHNAYPGKNLYFTEQWVGAPGNLAADLKWHVETLIIGATRNWSRNVIEWNLASDPSYDPHTEGGCTQCLGTVTLAGNIVVRNPAYYILAHSAKFVRPGSVRIATNVPGNLPNVAFKTPGGSKILIVVNTSDSQKTFYLKFRSEAVQLTLNSGAVGTYIW
jgi:glucosylceramidase